MLNIKNLMGKNWHKSKKNIFKSILVFIIVLFLLFFLAEAGLRIGGFKPGMLSPNWLNFKEVDTFKVVNSFYANAKGIFVADSTYFINEYDINEEGFRGQTFVRDSSKENILFLGDSYTWGSMAEPISSCFVDLVAKNGYHVFNTGIPGADPPQYLAIAKEYIPKLKPEHVCLMFYAGNDFTSLDRIHRPFENIFLITNAGWLSPYINGKYEEDARKVYDYYLNLYKIGHNDAFWKRLMGKSVIGTMILSIPKRMEERKMWVSNPDIAVHYVNEINTLCKTHNCTFHLFIIPLHTKISEPEFEKYSNIFNPLKVNVPDDISRNDFYEWPNGHLNNDGHQKYAKTILKKLKN